MKNLTLILTLMLASTVWAEDAAMANSPEFAPTPWNAPEVEQGIISDRLISHVRQFEVDEDNGKKAKSFELTEMISDNLTEYLPLIDALNKAEDKENIYIIVSSNGGGSGATLDSITKAMKASKAIVHVHVNGDNASAAAIIACFSDKLSMRKDATLQFHMGQVLDVGGKGFNDAYAEWQLEVKAEMDDNCVPRGILTHDQVDTVFKSALGMKANEEKPLLIVTEKEVLKTVHKDVRDYIW